ncbi:MAG: cobalt ECF transporter T component CbiQ [Peptococcaceae bacterium]|nr:cobalt ECF transporter T component CbiQ [Peptococcaceae bacterium]
MMMPACDGKGTLMYRIDSRVKVVTIFGFVAVASSLTSKPLLLAAALIITGLALISGIGAGCLLRKAAMVLPFAGVALAVLPFAVPGEVLFSIKMGPLSLAATQQGADRAAILSLRVLTAVLAVTTLTATTAFPDLMKAFRGLRIPEVFVQVLEFTVRYIFVLADELQRMRLARKSRCFESGGSLLNRTVFRTLGQLVGVLFIRSWDRGERIYCAMLSRGYSAGAGVKGRAPGIRLNDLFWGMGIVAAAVALRLFESGALQVAMK